MPKYTDRAKKGGRPRAITKPILRKLEEVFAYGGTDEEAAFYAGIGASTLYDYCQEHPEFSERKQALKLKPVLKARRTVFENLDDLGTARWFLERRMSREFGKDAEDQAVTKPPKTVEIRILPELPERSERKKIGRNHIVKKKAPHAI